MTADIIKKIKIPVVIILAALGMVSILQGCKNAIEYSQDFQWDAAKILSVGMNPYDESLHPSDALKGLGYEEYYKQMEANQFPSLLWLLLPYTAFTPLAARCIWLASNLLFTALIILLLRLTFFKKSERLDFAIASLLMLAGTPWRNQIGVGQHTLFSFMFFLLAVWLLERADEREDGRGLLFLSAMALSVSYFKYTLTAPLALYFIFKKRYGTFLLSLVPHVLLTVFSAIWLKDSFLNMIKKPLEVASWLSSEGSMDLGAMLGRIFPGSAALGMIAAALIMAALFILATVCGRGQYDAGDTYFISLLLLWSLIMTYHRSYDYFVMVLPLAYFEGRGIKKAIPYVCLLLYIFFALRLFHESDASLMAGAIWYYVYLVFFSIR